MISPFWDIFLSGGGAMLALGALVVFMPANGAHLAQQKAWLAATLAVVAFLVNDPHFIVSYQLLYTGYREKLARLREYPGLRLRYMMAGMVIPAIMAAYFLASFAYPALMGYAVQAMLFVVGWHYCKQAYGVFIMLSAMKKIFYAPWQKRLFLINSYVAWTFYCLSSLYQGAVARAAQDFFGVSYTFPDIGTIPDGIMLAATTAMLLGFFSSLIMAVWEKKASYTALVGYTSMYYLLYPAALHPFWIMLYPVFHSMQYLMFVYAYKRGESAALAKQGIAPGQLKRQLFMFVLLAFILGLLMFSLLPGALEQGFSRATGLSLHITAAFVLFINIHHYFIDNAIWRKEHKELAGYLFHHP